MTEGIYFADAELPFHVWVRERSGDSGYRWVLRKASGADEPAQPLDGEAPHGGSDHPAGRS
jgi:hypothetical protein